MFGLKPDSHHEEFEDSGAFDRDMIGGGASMGKQDTRSISFKK